MAATGNQQIRSASWSGAERVTLVEDGILVESRDALTGSWSPSRQVFFDEVRAVYRYRQPDWPYLAVILLYGLLALVFLGIVSAAMRTVGDEAVIAGGLVALALLALGVYRILLVQRPCVRVVGT